MTGLSCLTFVLIAFCCYASSMSKPTRNETTKLPHEQQYHHHQLPNEANYETRQKRSQLDFYSSSAGDFKDLNGIAEDLSDNAIVPVSQEMDVEKMPPLLYLMLLQKIKQIQNNERQLPTRRTPRLGRSIDFQLFDAGTAGGLSSVGHDFDSALNMANDYAIPRQFLPGVIKKSVQFKPRLGKRTQVCN